MTKSDIEPRGKPTVMEFSRVEAVKHYIASQEEHHRQVSFQDEFREFLRKYEIEFDERYVWD